MVGRGDEVGAQSAATEGMDGRTGRVPEEPGARSHEACHEQEPCGFRDLEGTGLG